MAKKQLTIEEKLQAALVPAEEQPYKVPENWCWVRHNSVLDISGGSQPSKSYFISEPREGYIQLYQTRDYGEHPVPVYIPNKYASKTTDEGDILLARYGGSLGKVFRARKGAYNVALAKVINLYPKILDREYLYLYYHSFFYQDFCAKASMGRSAQAGYNRGDMAKLLLPLPTIQEQSRIVARIESLFAKLDEAKEKIQEVLDGADLRRAAILHQAFTGKLTEKWRRENSVSDDWDYKLLYQTDIQIIDGDRGKNYPKKDEFTSSGYCVFLNAKNVTKNGFLFDEIQYISKEKDESLRKGKLERGDIVLTTRGTVGNIAYYDEKIPFDNMRINSGMVIYRGGMDFYKPFLIWLYKSSYIINQIKKLKTGSAQPQLPIKVMNNLNICIPSIPEQQEIVRLLDDLLSREQATVNACEKALNTIDTLKKSILARAFRGELGTNDPSEAGAQELLQEILAS